MLIAAALVQFVQEESAEVAPVEANSVVKAKPTAG